MVYDNVKLEDQAVICVDIDSNYSDFIVLRQGKLVYTRNFLVGANHLLGKTRPGGTNSAKRSSIPWDFIRMKTGTRRSSSCSWGERGACPPIGANAGNESGGAGRDDGTDPSGPSGQGVDLVRERRGTLCFSLSFNRDVAGRGGPGAGPDLQRTAHQKQMEGRRKQITMTGVLVLSIVMMLSTLFFIVFYGKSSYLAGIREIHRQYRKRRFRSRADALFDQSGQGKA